MKRIYYLGIDVWSRWLPVCASGFYLAIMTANLLGGGVTSRTTLSLAGFFSLFEILLLLLAGSLFLTRLSNIAATAAVAYCVIRLSGHGSGSPVVALYLVTASATIVALLGDKMPWYSGQKPSAFPPKFRELLLAVTTIGALGLVVVAVIRIRFLTHWMEHSLSITVPNVVTMLALVALFVGWLSVALGFTRHFTLPLLSLPSVLLLAHLAKWPSYLLIIPFTMCLSLALAAADRRNRPRRRSGGSYPYALFR